MVEHQIKAGRIEDHDLVDHRQLEVRVRIIDRHARALGHHQEKEREHADGHEHDKQRIAPRDSAQDRRKRIAPGDDGEAADGEKENRLGENGEPGLAAGTHPFKAAGHIERGEDLKKTPEREQISEQDYIAGKRNRRRSPERQQQRGERDRAPDDHRREAGDDSSARAVNGFLSGEPQQFVVGLKNRRAESPRESGFQLVHYAD